MKTAGKAVRALITAGAAAVILSGTAFAAEDNGLYVSSELLERGEEFAVTVSVPPAENADTASVKVVFDGDAFEVTEWEPELPGCMYASADDSFALSAANVQRSIDLSEGLELTAWLRVKDDAPDGDYTFDLAEASFCYVKDNGYEFEELWTPEDTQAYVSVSDILYIDLDDEDYFDIDDDGTYIFEPLDEDEDGEVKEQGITPVHIVIIVCAAAAITAACIIVMKHRK